MTQWVNPDTGTKRCTCCRQHLPVSEFRANAKLSSGLDSWCIECHRVATRKSREKYPEKYNARRRVSAVDR
jgi:hypothetical protein